MFRSARNDLQGIKLKLYCIKPSSSLLNTTDLASKIVWCDIIQGASRETDVFEMSVTEQVEGVEAWVGGN